MIEFFTSHDIMEQFVNMLEKERIRKEMTQKELYKASGMSATAYRTFMATKNTKFSNIINLLSVLGLSSKLEELVKSKTFNSLEEIRAIKNKKVKKRVKKSLKKAQYE